MILSNSIRRKLLSSQGKEIFDLLSDSSMEWRTNNYKLWIDFRKPEDFTEYEEQWEINLSYPLPSKCSLQIWVSSGRGFLRHKIYHSKNIYWPFFDKILLWPVITRKLKETIQYMKEEKVFIKLKRPPIKSINYIWP